MRTVAERLIPRVFTGAEKLVTGFLCFPGDGGEFRHLMGTVAKRLIFTSSAGTPEIGLACLHGNFYRCLLRDNWSCHVVTLLSVLFVGGVSKILDL